MCVTENNICSFSSKTYVVCTQKNRLNETVLLSTQNMFNLIYKEKNKCLLKLKSLKSVTIW